MDALDHQRRTGRSALTFRVCGRALAGVMAGASMQALAQNAITAPGPPIAHEAQENPQQSTGSNASSQTSIGAAAPPRGLEEIVVTAQKRSENVQDVPISIQAFSGTVLRDANINQVQDLTKLVPTFKFGSGPGTVAARNGIRGLGSFGNSAIEPSVATYLDGVYIPRAGSLNSTLIDVQSIEVLSGPQGSLFGRNASIGAISITTSLPTDKFEGSAAFEGGSGNRYRGELVANLPVSDTFAIRVVGLGEEFGGYWHQEPTGKRFGGIDTISFRLTTRWDITPHLSWIMRGDYASQTGDNWYNISLVPSTLTPSIIANLHRVTDGQLPTIGIGSDRSNQDVSTANIDDHHWGVSSTLNYRTESNYTIKLIDSYRNWRANETDGEVTFLPVPLVNRNNLYNSKSQNHELQLISPEDKLLGGRLNFITGLYYFQEMLDIDIDYNLRSDFCTHVIADLIPPLVPACEAGPQKSGFFERYAQNTKSYAGYAQATLEIVPRVDLTLGGRYTQERKDATYLGHRVNPAAVFGANENTSFAFSDHRFTGRANLDWKPTENILLFVTYSTGFKAGGFNSGAATVALTPEERTFGPETVKNYEFGAKSQFLDHRVTADITVFRDDVDGFQERALTSVSSIVRNVGSIRTQGVEAQIAVAPTQGLRFHVAVAYDDAEFTDYKNAPPLPWLTGSQDLTGARPTYAPKWSTSEGVELRHDLTAEYRASLRADVSTVSRQNINAVNDNSPRTFQKGYALLSARLSVFSPNDRYSLAVFGENLTDKHYCVNEGYLPLGPQLGAVDVAGQTEAVTCFHGNPRTVGARLGLKF